MSDNNGLPTGKHTLVEEGTELKGSISSSCPIVVMGKVEGEVAGPAIQITATGVVAGRVKVKELRSDGELAGEVEADVVRISGKVRDRTVIRARSLEVSLTSTQGGMQVVFGDCELAVGDEPDKAAAIAAATAQPAPPAEPAATTPAEPAPPAAEPAPAAAEPAPAPAATAPAEPAATPAEASAAPEPAAPAEAQPATEAAAAPPADPAEPAAAAPAPEKSGKDGKKGGRGARKTEPPPAAAEDATTHGDTPQPV